MWPFKRKRKSDIITKVINVPMPILIRQAIYDSIYHESEDISFAMGISPVSDEVAEMERPASEKRIDKFAGLLPFIESHADISARVSATAYLLQAEKYDDAFEDPENFEELVNLFKAICLSGTVACISKFIDLGLIESKVVSDDEQ